jgi:hypothetical protein
MSVATDEMIEAVRKKFVEEKQEAKKGMEHKEQIKAAVEKKFKVGNVKISNTDSSLAGIVKKLDKKQRRKDRRKKKNRTSVDQTAVAKSFKSTMANLSGTKTKKKYKRGPQL